MNLKDLLDLKYPIECKEGLIRCENHDLSNEEGWFIVAWDIEAPKPTNEDILIWKSEYESAFIVTQQRKEFNDINRYVLEALEEVDKKTIRALREKDQEKLEELNTEAEALRQKLRYE